MPDDAIYGGRGTPLGNPFRRESFGDDALGLYRIWLAVSLGILDPALRDWPAMCHKYRIVGVDDPRARSILGRAVPHDPAVLRQLRSIGTNTLIVCSCAPSPCHLDVVLGAWAWLKNSGSL